MTIRQAVVDRVGTAGADVLSRPLRLTLTSARRRSLAVLGAVWVFGALYESYFLYRGWFPQDEGALAESARRVLAGELPHRDFAELYTGALSYLHALGFQSLAVYTFPGSGGRLQSPTAARLLAITTLLSSGAGKFSVFHNKNKQSIRT